MTEKYCIFCGVPPSNKNKEHIIPEWLLNLTGVPNRKGKFGIDFSTGKVREYSVNSFVFPACQKCNSEKSNLESKVKTIVLDILDRKEIIAEDFNFLLDWFDKVRVGVWLGLEQLDKNKMFVPSFYINQRIAMSDRILVIFDYDGIGNGYTISGVDTIIFKFMPSAFLLKINNFVFMSVSNLFILSKKVGFPIPKKIDITNMNEFLIKQMLASKNDNITQWFHDDFPFPDLIVGQVIFDASLAIKNTVLYDKDFIKKMISEEYLIEFEKIINKSTDNMNLKFKTKILQIINGHFKVNDKKDLIKWNRTRIKEESITAIELLIHLYKIQFELYNDSSYKYNSDHKKIIKEINKTFHTQIYQIKKSANDFIRKNKKIN